ncbi:MAG: ABC transporter permease [Gemmatimonadaceae bacterium]
MTPPRDDDDLPLSRVPPVHEDVRREVAFHLEERTKELVARGMTLEQARAAAGEAFGDAQAVESECREIESRRRATKRRMRRHEELRQDLAMGLRLLRKSPGFTLAAIATLALGIGANTAVFSIVNRVFLQPLEYPDPDRLVALSEQHEKGTSNVPWANFVDLEEQSRTLSAMAAYGSFPATVLGTGTPIRVRAGLISKGFFHVFPVRPSLGRLPAPDEYTRGAGLVAVVSHAFWREQLGGRRSLDDVRLKMDREVIVIGVLPAGFDFPDENQVWVPMGSFEQSLSRTAHNWQVVGRLAPDVTTATAKRDLDAIMARLRSAYQPDFDATGVAVVSLQKTLTQSAETPLYLLLGASAILLLGACTNLASAQLARGTARSGELAVRSALGATRTRLIRQLLTESALLSVLGCLAGLGVAWVLLRSFARFAPAALHLERVQIDGWVLGFAALVAVATTLLFGLLPALRLSSRQSSVVVRDVSRGTADAGRMRAWHVFVVAEVALAVVLLTGSALLIRSFSLVMDTELGFATDRVITVKVNLPEVNYAPESPAIVSFHERVLERLRATPGMLSAGFTNVLPLEGYNPSGSLEIEGRPLAANGRSQGYAVYRVVGGDFFRALRIPLVEGRLLGPADDGTSAPVVVVNELFAREEWPNESAIGKRLRPAGMDASNEPWATVVGVVGNVRAGSMTDAFHETFYFEYRQRPAHRALAVSYVVHSRLDAASVERLVRAAITSVDPQVPLDVQAMNDVVSASVADRRFTMMVLGAFSAVALLLAIVGIYAVVSYVVAQRTREIGVRIALGATPVGVLRMIVVSALAAVGPGLVLGTALAFANAGAIRSLLYGVSPFDLTALGATLLLLTIAAVASSIGPAWKASRVDPVRAIRGE